MSLACARSEQRGRTVAVGKSSSCRPNPGNGIFANDLTNNTTLFGKTTYRAVNTAALKGIPHVALEPIKSRFTSAEAQGSQECGC
jgi:hypothetical protein